MKKVLLAVLICAILAAAVFAVVFFTNGTEPGELLQNPGFETGDSSGFEKYGYKSTMTVGAEYAHTGAYGMRLTERTQYHSTYAQMIGGILTKAGPGTYKASVWVKLAEGAVSGGDCRLVIEYQTNSSDKAQYYESEWKTLTDQWQVFEFEGELEFDPADGFVYAYIYPESYDAGFVAPDVCIDDFSLMKTGKANGISADNAAVLNENRSATSTVGAIRWDAWTAHDGRKDSVITQVEATLSPSQFHFRAPFFAEVTDDGGIIIPDYTQETFDREMEYAMEAGIDYFAYVWYNDEMSTARKFHTTSQYKNDVKMCACIIGSGVIGDNASRKEISSLLGEDHYMTVLDGRPLVYYFVTKDTISLVADDIAYYRQAAAQAGLPDPYVVVMNVSTTALETMKLGADAISNYSVAGGGNMAFADLADKAYNYWEEYRRIGAQYVPIVTFGWQTEPRYINPVVWQTIKENTWAQYGTPDELEEHLSYALAYLNHPDVAVQTDANTCIIYAWNEHDEGGWICPTIAVDENGAQLYNEDGTPMIDTSHLLAVKQAIENYKNGVLPEVVLDENGGSSSEGSGGDITS